MKIRTGHISNSSTCSFVIPIPFITEEQKDKVWRWYSEKSETTYMDDEGRSIAQDGRFLVGNIAYVVNEFLDYAEEIGIDRNNILLLEQ